MEIFGDSFTSIEEEVTLPITDELVMTGHPDGVIKDYDAVYELKTVGLFGFAKVESDDKPYSAHIDQANLYAHALGTKNIIIHYFDSSSCKSKFFLIPYNADLARTTVQKFADGYSRLATGKFIDRPHSDPTSSPCSYCDYQVPCYEGWTDQVEKMGYREIDPEKAPGLHTTAKMAYAHKQDRLSATKWEDKMKKSLSEELIKTETREASVGEYHVKVKIGTRGNPIVSVDHRP
jgi:hypothetical protein